MMQMRVADSVVDRAVPNGRDDVWYTLLSQEGGISRGKNGEWQLGQVDS